MTASSIAMFYRRVRRRSTELCAPLTMEDHVIQSMEDASPARWHLAHTTWFFETFVLKPHAAKHGVMYCPPNPRYEYLFNSYYNGVGTQFPRAKRGTLSRPTVREVHDWRRAVDEAMERLLAQDDPEVLRVATIGLYHEEQHQELLVTDIKHGLASNPLRPVYREDVACPVSTRPGEASGVEIEGGVFEVGHRGSGFCFDNETPRHRALVHPCRLDGELVTNKQWLSFMQDRGYQRHELWLSDGWAVAQVRQWCAPLYWFLEGEQWWEITLGGARPVVLDAPVTHVSFFEADAFARWKGASLPTEFVWERAAEQTKVDTFGTVLDDEVFHPVGASMPAQGGARHLLGEVWEWTASPYRPYPGYQPLPGALGEYNGKFMNNQFVLRGGSCATPRDHIRTSYRNFFAPDKRWQFTGVRLVWDR